MVLLQETLNRKNLEGGHAAETQQTWESTVPGSQREEALHYVRHKQYAQHIVTTLTGGLDEPTKVMTFSCFRGSLASFARVALYLLV